jgi:hypothetical protein
MKLRSPEQRHAGSATPPARGTLEDPPTPPWRRITARSGVTAFGQTRIRGPQSAFVCCRSVENPAGRRSARRPPSRKIPCKGHFSGGCGWSGSRTHDTRVISSALYPLSYPSRWLEWDSNPQPPSYQLGALSIELSNQGLPPFALEPVRGIHALQSLARGACTAGAEGFPARTPGLLNPEIKIFQGPGKRKSLPGLTPRKAFNESPLRKALLGCRLPLETRIGRRNESLPGFATVPAQR